MATVEQPQKTKVRSAGLEDQASSKDFLGFTPYVNALFNFLEHEQTKPPFTLTIEGDWGSGKSSFMLQLQNKLKEEERIVINFNAWRHDKMESMWAAFALTFIQKLSRSRNIFFRPFLNLVVLLRRYNWRKGLGDLLLKVALIAFYVSLAYSFYNRGGLETVNEFLFNDKGKIEELKLNKLISSLGFIGLVIGAVFFLRKITDIFGNPLTIELNKYVDQPNYKGQMSFIESFHADFDKAVRVLAVGKKKIYVFIDDLDRAEIPKAAELMQGLNMMISNSPKIIFIIGMDREKVVAGVGAKYESLIKIMKTDAIRFGSSFLQKFIQLSFRIPKPTKVDVKAFIDFINNPKAKHQNSVKTEEDYAHAVLLEDGEDAEAIKTTVELVAPYFECNPRLIKQFINAFRLKCHIALNTGLFSDKYEEPMTIQQIGKFVAMVMVWPNVIDDLLLHPSLIHEALSKPEVGQTFSQYSEKWRLEGKFMELLQNMPSGNYDVEYDMTDMNYKRLLETSPEIVISPDAKIEKGIGDSDDWPGDLSSSQQNPTGSTNTRHTKFDRA